MNEIVSQVRLDNARNESYGRANGILGLIYIPALLALVVAIILPKDSDFGSYLFGGFCSGLAMATAVYAIWPFLMTEQMGDQRLDGLVPINRVHQVIGRYITAALVVVAFVVGLLTMPAIFAIFALSVDVSVPGVLGVSALFVLLVSDMLLPFLYKFSGVAVFKYMMFAILGILVLALLVSRIHVDWLAVLNSIVDFLSASTVRTVLLGVLVAVVATAISMACSLHIYTHKDI
ncbi:hypothetical protein KIM372_10210 [Bombiscardovia nodaiensis]|uniref:ABC-2 transporter permease n=1 Tax=Bombiscardovia nodaiensis TaxID=2932181 RepID=A0ABN6SAK8_9BIFI|nr:hypothetical protein KIM372_10210 [Bombiscardovia nodaiensis]